jgi:UDP-N-acetyl-D-glucosamine dehydrogenase
MTSAAAVDLVLIVTDHSALPYEQLVAAAPVVFDTRNATRAIKSSKIIKI